MLMFLLDVEDFSASLHAISSTHPATYENETRQFAEFVVIVNNYIKDGSPFEISIESKTKIDVLKMTDRATFINQSLVCTRT